MPLDRKAAEAAILREIADPTGQSLEAAAASILELANEHMVQAILDVTLSQGIDPASAAFVAGGGAAGLNCVAIGRRLGCRTVYVPEIGAALAAAGALISDLTSHHQAMRHTTSESFDFDGRQRGARTSSKRAAAPSETSSRGRGRVRRNRLDDRGPLSGSGVGDRGAAAPSAVLEPRRRRSVSSPISMRFIRTFSPSTIRSRRSR